MKQTVTSLAVIKTRAQRGIDAIPVDVEVHLSKGLPGMSIVGLPEKAVKESRDRVRSALLNCGYEFPARKIIINLAPADLPKEGGRYDLAIAIGMLVAGGYIPPERTHNTEFLGELALDGHLRPVRGLLPAVIACKGDDHQIICPVDNQHEACLINNAPCHVAKHLLDVSDFLINGTDLPKPEKSPHTERHRHKDFADVKGQFQAKRALEIAAAGKHNVLMIGPPGTGKSMLASRLTSILPTLSEPEALEVATIQSINPLHQQKRDFYERPYRAPHHSASHAALVGGGTVPKPGEMSLAHRGVLFLDELPEFSRPVLEVLREPLETGHVSISRAHSQVDFPANVQLITAMNPCPCGYATSTQHDCTCTPTKIDRYRQKISGPLLDRIDCHLHVGEVDQATLMSAKPGEQSARIKQRVADAQRIQLNRQGCLNAELDTKQIDAVCALSSADQQWLSQSMNKLKLSARSYHRLLKLARTIADCQQLDRIDKKHLCEAISLRKLQK